MNNKSLIYCINDISEHQSLFTVGMVLYHFNKYPLGLVSTYACAQGGTLDFWNGGANVLISQRLIWGLKFRGPKGAICSLESEVGKIIWGLIFLVCHCPNYFLSVKFFRNWTADYNYLGCLKMLV